MSKLNILEFPDPRLRTIAEPVEKVNDDIRKLIDDMFETMYDANGIGLAATQVNIHLQVVVIDLSDDSTEPLVLINPSYKIIEEELDEMQEGCLSVPGFYDTVERPRRIAVESLDRHGNPQNFEADGLLAVCIQHELDHLDGKLFVDYLSKLKRQRIRSKLEKQHKLDQQAQR